jgi:hypothetical protein
MSPSIYNILCSSCRCSKFQHLLPDVKIRLAMGSNVPDADLVAGPCTECGCTQFVPPKQRGISLRPSSSRNDIAAARALKRIDEMLSDDSGPGGDSIWAFAFDTLEGIQSTIQQAGTCTDAQMAAIDNIYDGGIRGSGRDSRWQD